MGLILPMVEFGGHTDQSRHVNCLGYKKVFIDCFFPFFPRRLRMLFNTLALLFHIPSLKTLVISKYGQGASNRGPAADT